MSESPFARFRADDSRARFSSLSGQPHLMPVRAVTQLKVLAFDQSLGKTGWAFLEHGDLQAKGLIETPQLDIGGPPSDIERGAILHDAASSLIVAMEPEVIVFEMPMVRATQKNPYVRISSAMAAAMAIKLAAVDSQTEHYLFSAKKAKKYLTGNANADKDIVHQAIARSLNLPKTNEHVRDAIALTFLLE